MRRSVRIGEARRRRLEEKGGIGEEWRSLTI